MTSLEIQTHPKSYYVRDADDFRNNGQWVIYVVYVLLCCELCATFIFPLASGTFFFSHVSPLEKQYIFVNFDLWFEELISFIRLNLHLASGTMQL